MRVSLIGKLFQLKGGSAGATIIELSVSLLLMSVITTGFVGSVAVGATVASRVEDQDISLVAARSQAEFIASQPPRLILCTPRYPRSWW